MKHPQIETIRTTRTALLNLIKDLSTEELNEIPAGFNNNIIWNLGHVIAAQQGVCYFRAGLKMQIEDTFFQAYRPDSRPEKFVGAAEIETTKQLLFSTLDQFQTDLDNNLFSNYTPWTTRYGVAINNINDAVNFLPFHEGLHMGYIMALKRVVKSGVLQ